MAATVYAEIPDHYYGLAVWWQETRLKPLYIQLCRVWKNQPGSMGPKNRKELASLGYFHHDLIDYRITSDDLLANEGIRPIAEPSREPKPTRFSRGPFLSDLRPPYGVLDPATHFKGGHLYMLTVPSPSWGEAPKTQEPERRDGDAKERTDVVDEWTKEVPESFAQARAWAIESYRAEKEAGREPPLGLAGIDRQAHLIYGRPSLRRWSLLPIAVDWKLGRTDFLRVMKDFYNDCIKPIQRRLGEEPPERAAWKQRLKNVTALHDVWNELGPIRYSNLSGDERARLIGERAKEIHDRVGSSCC